MEINSEKRKTRSGLLIRSGYKLFLSQKGLSRDDSITPLKPFKIKLGLSPITNKPRAREVTQRGKCWGMVVGNP